MENTFPIEHHPLTPFLPNDGRILMLGSFPPAKSRWCMDFYYPNFTNDMWRVFGCVFFDDPLHFVDYAKRTYRKQEIVDFLNEMGIGIFDTASAVRRLKENASDKYLEVVLPTDVESLLNQMPQCKTIVTTGQKATDTLCAHFGISEPKMGNFSVFLLRDVSFRLYRMPSTSRAYPLPLEKKAEAYKKMFAEVLYSSNTDNEKK